MQVNGRWLIFLLACAFVGGYFSGHRHGPASEPTMPPTTSGNATASHSTTVAYVPKPSGDKTDIEAKLGKPAIVVRVNGQEATFKKDDSESFALEKNKVTLDQTSKVVFDVKVPEIDRTKNNALSVFADPYSFGLGYRHDRWTLDLGKTWEGGYTGRIHYDLLQW